MNIFGRKTQFFLNILYIFLLYDICTLIQSFPFNISGLAGLILSDLEAELESLDSGLEDTRSTEDEEEDEGPGLASLCQTCRQSIPRVGYIFVS